MLDWLNFGNIWSFLFLIILVLFIHAFVQYYEQKYGAKPIIAKKTLIDEESEEEEQQRSRRPESEERAPAKKKKARQNRRRSSWQSDSQEARYHERIRREVVHRKLIGGARLIRW